MNKYLMLYLTLITGDMSLTLKYLKDAVCRYRSVKKDPNDVNFVELYWFYLLSIYENDNCS